MWLINAETRKLKYFINVPEREYAILSHTWGEDEVDFQTMQSGQAQGWAGYTKIDYTCHQALADGLSYAWIDTCCIDKKSSAELSESINSMFSYYQKADVCYVYLSDAPASTWPRISGEDSEDSRQNVTRKLVRDLKDCRWFTRGWTLQELLAPPNIRFFDAAWNWIGDKIYLRDALKIITRIDEAALGNFHRSDSEQMFSVAKKMSWAANRSTTRVEDRAYSLLGLFKINLPLIYGEGHRAFIRLQEEIIRTTSDHSIFAWEDRNRLKRHATLLAESPDDFMEFSSVVSLQQLDVLDHLQMNNQGLQGTFMKNLGQDDDRRFFAVLRCRYGHDFIGPLALNLQRVGSEESGASIYHVDYFNHERFTVIPEETAQRAQPSSGIILRERAFFSSQRNPIGPHVWFRINKSATTWTDTCDPFPPYGWVEHNVFSLHTISDSFEQIGCKILNARNYDDDRYIKDNGALAVAFGFYFVRRSRSNLLGSWEDYDIRLGVGEPDPALCNGEAKPSAQNKYAKSLLVKPQDADKPSLSWSGKQTVKVTIEKDFRMETVLFIMNVDIQ